MYPNLWISTAAGVGQKPPRAMIGSVLIFKAAGVTNVWIFKAAGVAGRVAVTSIDFGSVFVRVLRRKVHLGLAAGDQVEFHDKPEFCSSRLCTVKNLSPGGFGTAGGQN